MLHILGGRGEDLDDTSSPVASVECLDKLDLLHVFQKFSESCYTRLDDLIVGYSSVNHRILVFCT